jgi:hypothetical protein
MKLIPGSEHYFITEDGNVINNKTGKTLKPEITQRGYYRIEIRINGNKKRLYVHKLVAQAYLPNPDNKPMVDHRDQQKHNNHKRNLRWVTNQENMLLYAMQHLTQYKRQSEARKGVKSERIKPVVQRALDGSFIKRFNSVKEAKKSTGIQIAGALSGRYKTAGGFKWEFADIIYTKT